MWFARREAFAALWKGFEKKDLEDGEGDQKKGKKEPGM